MGKQIDHNSFWVIKQNPITKIGVFPYLGRQISPELEPNKIYQVLRPESELFTEEALASFNALPITIGHALLGPREEGFTPAEEKGIDGTTGASAERKDDKVVNDIKLFSERIKDEVNHGKKELSAGYFCDFVPESGTWNGRHYDFVQKNIRGNHIALVDKGRSGHDVRVMDSAEGVATRQFVCDSMDLEGKFEEKEITMEKKASDAQWEENKHPRGSNGQFASSGKAGAKEDKVGAKLKDLLKGGEQDMDKLLSILEEDGFVGTGRHDEPTEEAEDAQWDESKHKRDSDGKFSSTGGGSKSTKSDSKADSLKKAYADLKKYQGSAAGKKAAVALRDGKKNPSAHYEELMATYAKKHGLDPQEFKDYHFEQIVEEGKAKQAKKTAPAEHFTDKQFINQVKRSEIIEDIKHQKGLLKRAKKYPGLSKDIEKKIKSLEKELSKIKGIPGWDSDPLVSKNHGNSGLDAATGKEMTMEQLKKAIEAIKALFANPEEGDKDAKLAEIISGLKDEPAADDKCATDEDVDKRKLIDEIGGILSGKVDDEIIRTVLKKAEEIAYNDSTAETADDEEETEEVEEEAEEKEDKKVASLDEMEKALLARLSRKAELVKQLTPIIGAFDSADMTEKEVASYACKKLNLSAAMDEAPAVVKGYLAGRAKTDVRVTFGAKAKTAAQDEILNNFKEGK